MPKITIDGKEYDTEKLPKEAVDLINSIAYVDAEAQRLQNQLKILQAARRTYSEDLKKILDNLPSSDEKLSFS